MEPGFLELFMITLVAGAAAGLVAGLLGVGGGIVMVPVLYHIFAYTGAAPDTAMHVAVGTSLAVIVPTSVVSAYGHQQRGAIDWPVLRRWSPGVVIGVVIGAALAAYFSGDVLQLLFGLLLLAVAGRMGLASAHAPVAMRRSPHPSLQWVVAKVIGAVSSLLGIGGGTMMVPALSVLGFPIHRAVATAAAMGFVISLPAAVGHTIGGWNSPGLPPGSTGFVNWIAFAALAPMTLLCVPMGVRLAYRLPQVALRRAASIFIAAVGVRMLLF